MGNSNWPKNVPVLNENDICKGAFNKGDRRDITSWINQTFKGTARTKVLKTLRVVTNNPSLIDWNDSKNNRRRDIARVFNTVTAALGYNKGNPENLRGYNLRRRLKANGNTQLLPRRVANSV